MTAFEESNLSDPNQSLNRTHRTVLFLVQIVLISSGRRGNNGGVFGPRVYRRNLNDDAAGSVFGHIFNSRAEKHFTQPVAVSLMISNNEQINPLVFRLANNCLPGMPRPDQLGENLFGKRFRGQALSRRKNLLSRLIQNLPINIEWQPWTNLHH